jgi:hypothetical protein
MSCPFSEFRKDCSQRSEVLRARRLQPCDLKFGHRCSNTIPPALDSNEAYVLLSRELRETLLDLSSFANTTKALALEGHFFLILPAA